MLPPLIIFLFMLMLALACVGLLVYQAVLFITGSATWDAAWFPILLGQLGAVFFGIFAMGAWGQHRDRDIQILLGWLLCGVLLEVSALTGYAAHYEYSTSSALVNHGTRTQGNITDVTMHTSRSGKSLLRKLWFTYEFHTPAGNLIQGKAGASYYWLTQESLKMLSKHRHNVPVLYLEENPQRSIIDNYWLLWDQTIILGAFSTISGASCLFFLYRLFRPTRRKPRHKKRSRAHLSKKN